MTETEREPAPDGSRLFARLSWVAVAAGVAFYLIHYLGGRALWLDEIMIGLNLKYLSFEELRGKLHYDQVAPIGWLYLEKVALSLSGNLEYGLRSISLSAGIGALVLFRQTAFKALPAVGAFCATLIFAFSGVLVRFAAEVKPYMVDVVLSVAALWCVVSILKAGRLTPWTTTAFALTGFATVLASFSAVYVLAAAGIVLFLKFALRRQWKPAAVLVLIGLGWLVLFGAQLQWLYLPNLEGNHLTEGGASHFFERTAYAPFPPTSAADVVWYLSWTERFIEFVFSREAWFPAAALIGLGVFGYVRRDWPLVVMGVGPVVIMLIGSSFGVLPAFQRLTLFAAPGLILLAGAGAAYVTKLSRGATVPALVLSGLLVAGYGGYLVGNLFKQSPPFAQHQVGPVLKALKQNLRPGDKVFIPNMALPAWVAYRDAYGLKNVEAVEGVMPDLAWSCTIEDMVSTGVPGRYWIVYIFNERLGNPDAARLDPIVGEKGLQASFQIRAEAPQVMLVQADISPRTGGPLPPAPPELCPSDEVDHRFATPDRIRQRAGME